MKKEYDYVDIYEYQEEMYRPLIDFLFFTCSYYQIADEFDAIDITDYPFHDELIRTHRAKEWAATVCSRKVPIYTLQCGDKSKAYFRKLEKFVYLDSDGAYVDAGTNASVDLSFHLKNDECIFLTIAHEMCVLVREDIMNKYFKKYLLKRL